MRRTAVVCMLFAATFGITGTANASIAAASPEAGTGSHVQTVIHNVRPAARPASKGPATPAIQGSAGEAGKGAVKKGVVKKGAAAEAAAKPVTTKPVTAKPVSAKPVTAKPVTAKPVSAKPVTAKPVTAKPVTSKPAAAKVPAATKMVAFDGYTFDVPATWPVYRLGRGSTQCVRYDIDAVYLGVPGTNQQCPAGLVGQADTVSIAPCAQAVPSGYPAAQLQSAEVGGSPDQQAALSVSTTYGTDPGAVGQVLQSMRTAKTGAPAALHQSAPATGTAAPTTAQPGECSGSVAGSSPSQAGTSPSPAGTGSAATQPSGGPSAAAGATLPAKPSASPTSAKPSASPTSAKPTPKPTSTAHLTAKSTAPLPGFDTCTAPSVSAMKAWRKTYSAAAIYIGGQEMACDYGNLSASWVKSVRAMGWSLIPIYVGLQAPCNSFSQEINPAHAAPQGTTAATTAVSDAKGLGLGQGGPVYFDMEAYNGGNTTCRNSVLSFLNEWTRQLHALHYLSGVYSSAASGAQDLGSATTVYGRALAKPDSMWFALWDNKANTAGTPYLLSSWWNPGRRIKQYQGAHWVKAGGVKLDIDSDWVQGAVY
jgi:Domain of unknown function (DUF1906)